MPTDGRGGLVSDLTMVTTHTPGADVEAAWTLPGGPRVSITTGERICTCVLIGPAFDEIEGRPPEADDPRTSFGTAPDPGTVRDLTIDRRARSLDDLPRQPRSPSSLVESERCAHLLAMVEEWSWPMSGEQLVSQAGTLGGGPSARGTA